MSLLLIDQPKLRLKLLGRDLNHFAVLPNVKGQPAQRNLISYAVTNFRGGCL